MILVVGLINSTLCGFLLSKESVIPGLLCGLAAVITILVRNGVR